MPHSHPDNFLTARPGELPLSDHKRCGLALLLRHARCAQRDWGRFYRKSRKSGFHHTLYTRKTREILPKSTKKVPGPLKIKIKIIASRGTERWPVGRPLPAPDTLKPKNKSVKNPPVGRSSNGAPDFRLLHRLLCWRWAGFDARNGIYGKNGPRGVLGWWWLGV